LKKEQVKNDKKLADDEPPPPRSQSAEIPDMDKDKSLEVVKKTVETRDVDGKLIPPKITGSAAAKVDPA
jgi:hypothetical protein